MKVKITYEKIITFETEMTQEEIDNIAIHGIIPDRVDEMMNDIDNEQPAEFKQIRRIES